MTPLRICRGNSTKGEAPSDPTSNGPFMQARSSYAGANRSVVRPFHGALEGKLWDRVRKDEGRPNRLNLSGLATAPWPCQHSEP